MNISKIEDLFVVSAAPTGVSVYDFEFGLHFDCTHPSHFDGETCILRIGAIEDYATIFTEYASIGLNLVNSPTEHLKCSNLEYWYPLIEDLTPKSLIYETLPPKAEVEAEFDWPIFVKGARQTSRHNPDLSIIKNAEAYKTLTKRYVEDSILHWQKPVIRQFVPLMPAEGLVPGKPPVSVEYRSFWWHGECIGCDRYWYQVPAYERNSLEKGVEVAAQVARRLACPFLVVDFALTAEGDWIVIECNDAQESGYAAILPQLLWRAVVESAMAGGNS